MEQNLKDTVLVRRIKKLKTISDIFKFLDINRFNEILEDKYFKEVIIKTFRVFYELSILWLQLELPEMLFTEVMSRERKKNTSIDKKKIFKKLRSFSSEKIRKKISEMGFMDIATEIYAILDSLNSAEKAEEIFKLDEHFFKTSPDEIIERINLKIEEEKFLFNELSDLLKKYLESPVDNNENLIIH